MTNAYYLSGYNKNTDHLETELDVPVTHLVTVLQTLQMTVNDIEDCDALSLNSGEADMIAQYFNETIDSVHCDWFLETAVG